MPPRGYQLDLSGMSLALFVANYIEQTPFVWVHFTSHGLVRGSGSLACLGYHFFR